MNPVHAVDGFSGSVGDGSVQVDALRLSARWVWPYRWLHRDGWLFTGYWELGLGHWNNEIKVPERFTNNASATHEIWVASIAPVFRWQRESATDYDLIPFIEAGIGGSMFSNRRLASKKFDPRRFGTRYQFESFAGGGLRFGNPPTHEISVRKYHYSNADFHRNNQGMDLYMFSYGSWF